MIVKTRELWSGGYNVTIEAPYAHVTAWCLAQWGVHSTVWRSYNYNAMCEIWVASESHLAELTLAWS